MAGPLLLLFAAYQMIILAFVSAKLQVLIEWMMAWLDLSGEDGEATKIKQWRSSQKCFQVENENSFDVLKLKNMLLLLVVELPSPTATIWEFLAHLMSQKTSKNFDVL